MPREKLQAYSLLSPKKITEAEFLSQVIKLARACGWKVAHFRPAQTARGWRTAVQGDGKGFPDLVLAKRCVLFVELKVPPNKCTPEQLEWIEDLTSARARALIWTPDDWPEIKDTLWTA